MWAIVEPTRPHPMITMCTLFLPALTVPDHGITWHAVVLAQAIPQPGPAMASAGAWGRDDIGAGPAPGRRSARAERRRGRARRLVRGPAGGGPGDLRAARAARGAGPRGGHPDHFEAGPGRGDGDPERFGRPGPAAVPARPPGRRRRLRLAARQPGGPARAEGRGRPPAAAAHRRPGA